MKHLLIYSSIHLNHWPCLVLGTGTTGRRGVPSDFGKLPTLVPPGLGTVGVQIANRKDYMQETVPDPARFLSALLRPIPAWCPWLLP